MDLTGRYEIPAPPSAVWDAINNPEVLRACIPGCQQIEKTDDTHFEAAAKLKIGPVSATFKGKVALEDLDPPHRCVLRGEGQGGVAGFAKGEADVLLEPSETGTVLTYTAKASVGGKLAQVGQRLISGAAKQIADDFFAKFAAEVTRQDARQQQGDERTIAEAQAIADANSEVSGVTMTPEVSETIVPEAGLIPPPEPAGAQGPRSASTARGRREGVAPEIWVVGLVAVIVILLVLFGLVL